MDDADGIGTRRPVIAIQPLRGERSPGELDIGTLSDERILTGVGAKLRQRASTRNPAPVER
jgi:hypothetical protein